MLTNQKDYMKPRDLGDGLIMRWSRAEDAKELAYMESRVFRDKETDQLNEKLEHLIHELLSGSNPLQGSDGFALVEDTKLAEHPIVAATCLWRQQVDFAGIPISMGRPELVASNPDYRNRGLVRALFELIHVRSEAEGDLMQGITGIPYFYRQFGYEYALDLDGHLNLPIVFVPPLKEGETEPITLREATSEDLPLIRELYERECEGKLVTTLVETRWWQYNMDSWRTSQTGENFRSQIILDQAGNSIGYLNTPAMRRGDNIPVWECGTAPNVNLQAITPALLRLLLALGPEMRLGPKAKEIANLKFVLSSGHPLYDILEHLAPIKRQQPYAWYLRVPNLPAFIRQIAPVLERRLLHSAVSGYSGELRLNFYRGGLRMVFEKGRLTTVENWKRPLWDAEEEAGFPPLVFLQLLFGYRSLTALRQSFPDVSVEDHAQLLLQTLFPVQPSWLQPIG